MLASIPMTGQEIRVAKKRGRPATGRGYNIGVRLHPDQLAALDAWIDGQPEPLCRAAAIRALLASALDETRPGSRNKRQWP
jgi:hypothetical protein